MKEIETTNLITEPAPETSKISVDDFINANRNSFEVLSEVGMKCGVFGGTFGFSLVLMSSIFGASEQVHRIAVILIFFSLILIMNGVANKHRIAESKKSRPQLESPQKYTNGSRKLICENQPV